MISITGEYLLNIIERQVNRTIAERRNHPAQELNAVPVNDASNEEIADFILSIPYFDEGIKNFILGISNDQTIIISQSWEIAFMVRAAKWAESDDWLHGAFRLSMSIYDEHIKGDEDFLTLPY